MRGLGRFRGGKVEKKRCKLDESCMLWYETDCIYESVIVACRVKIAKRMASVQHRPELRCVLEQKLSKKVVSRD